MVLCLVMGLPFLVSHTMILLQRHNLALWPIELVCSALFFVKLIMIKFKSLQQLCLSMVNCLI